MSHNTVYNIIKSTATGCDASGLDIDQNTANIIYEYNYVYNTTGPCQLLDQAGSYSGVANFPYGYTGNVVRYNVYENCGGLVGGTGIFEGTADGYPATTDIYNNTFYSTQTTPTSGNSGNAFVSLIGTGGAWTGVIKNNIMYSTRAGIYFINMPGGSGHTIDYNDYYQAAGTHEADFKYSASTYTSLAAWQSAVGQDAHSTTINPNLTAPGTAGACTEAPPTSCLGHYRLTSSSPLIGAGVNLSPINVGTVDIFGNSIPNGVGTGYNIGADGGNPGEGGTY